MHYDGATDRLWFVFSEERTVNLCWVAASAKGPLTCPVAVPGPFQYTGDSSAFDPTSRQRLC